MNTILTIFALRLPVYDIWRYFVNLPRPPVFSHIYASCLSVFVKPIPGYIASGRNRVNIHIGCSYAHFLFFFEKQAGFCFDVTNLTVSHGLHYL